MYRKSRSGANTDTNIKLMSNTQPLLRTIDMSTLRSTPKDIVEYVRDKHPVAMLYLSIVAKAMARLLQRLREKARSEASKYPTAHELTFIQELLQQTQDWNETTVWTEVNHKAMIYHELGVRLSPDDQYKQWTRMHTAFCMVVANYFRSVWKTVRRKRLHTYSQPSVRGLLTRCLTYVCQQEDVVNGQYFSAHLPEGNSQQEYLQLQIVHCLSNRVVATAKFKSPSRKSTRYYRPHRSTKDFDRRADSTNGANGVSGVNMLPTLSMDIGPNDSASVAYVQQLEVPVVAKVQDSKPTPPQPLPSSAPAVAPVVAPHPVEATVEVEAKAEAEVEAEAKVVPSPDPEAKSETEPAVAPAVEPAADPVHDTPLDADIARVTRLFNQPSEATRATIADWGAPAD